MVSSKSEKLLDAQVGARLKARREELGMSQEKLSEAFGVTFQQVQKYENGTNRLGSSRIAQAAAALKVPPTYFFGAVEKGKTNKKSDVGGAETDQLLRFLRSEEGGTLAKAFQRISGAAKRKAIVRLVEGLAGES